jgi:hypothetical protein
VTISCFNFLSELHRDADTGNLNQKKSKLAQVIGNSCNTMQSCDITCKGRHLNTTVVHVDRNQTEIPDRNEDTFEHTNHSRDAIKSESTADIQVVSLTSEDQESRLQIDAWTPEVCSYTYVMVSSEELY